MYNPSTNMSSYILIIKASTDAPLTQTIIQPLLFPYALSSCQVRMASVMRCCIRAQDMQILMDLIRVYYVVVCGGLARARQVTEHYVGDTQKPSGAEELQSR